MKVIRCSNGHYYDHDVYGSCPHCEGENAGTEKKKVLTAKPARKPFVFGRARKEETEENKSASDLNMPETESGSVICEPTEIMSPTEFEKLMADFEEKKKAASATVSEEASVMVSAKETSGPTEEKTGEGAAEEQSCGTEDISDESEIRSVIQSETEADESPENESDELVTADCGEDIYSPPESGESESPSCKKTESGSSRSEYVKNKRMSAEKICGPTVWVPADADMSEPGFRPVAGWLVAVSGPCKGRSYEIKQGRNTVGRGAENDICIMNDNRVSRSKHMKIVYDPAGRVYYIEPGDGSGLVYCNGEIILAPTAVTGSDSVEIGGGTYIIQPLEGDYFSV